MEGITIRVLAISDIHGCYDEFNQLLLDVCFDPDEDRLILLGDYVDRGLRSKEVVEQVMALQDCGVITLRGNHDQMMLDAILLDTEEVNSRWIRNGARHTIESYCGADFFEGEMERDKYNEGKAYIKKHYEHHLAFLNTLRLYYETDTHIFVHAGINPAVEDWKQQVQDDFIWIRDKFYNYPTRLPKTVVFGHTPAINLHASEKVWFSEDGDKIGIDGACVYGKQLNCLEIREGEVYQTYFVPLKQNLEK
ncbi:MULTISPECIES: metallophosphoesterase family protein [Paenibacillus]|uniref:metallophosphoesterase family protein n=1 Tax=Paenibacillus TaxID=44249 RepID=UPI0022847FC8|nr:MULTISPECIES: metallophosphoesterase family protein [Paenibacillus]